MKYDVLLTPTMPFSPIKIGEFADKGMHKIANEVIKHFPFRSLHKIFMKPEMLDQKYFKFIAFTLLFNITGQPAMSVPLAWDDKGFPIGCQFAGRYADEVTLFQLAGQLERAKPWIGRYK